MNRYRTSKRVAEAVEETAKQELDRRVSDRLDEGERDELAGWIEDWVQETVNGCLKVKAAEKEGHELK